jgi:hypothetical protein
MHELIDTQVIGSCGTQTCGVSGSQTNQCQCLETTQGVAPNTPVSPTLCPGACQNSAIPCPTLPCCRTFQCQIGTSSPCSSTCGNGLVTTPATCTSTCNGVASPTSTQDCANNNVPCQITTQPCTICPVVAAQTETQVQYNPVQNQVQPLPTVQQTTFVLYGGTCYTADFASQVSASSCAGLRDGALGNRRRRATAAQPVSAAVVLSAALLLACMVLARAG